MIQFIENMYKKFSWVNTDTGLLILRIGVGAMFIYSGWMKLTNLQTTIGYFAAIGFVAFWVYLVMTVELLGGLTVLLGVGIYTRIAAKLLSIVMIVAVYLLRGNFAMAMTPLLLLFMTLALMCTGSGKYSVLREKN